MQHSSLSKGVSGRVHNNIQATVTGTESKAPLPALCFLHPVQAEAAAIEQGMSLPCVKLS